MSKKVDTKTKQFQFLQKYLNSTKRESKNLSTEEPQERSKKSEESKQNNEDWLTK